MLRQSIVCVSVALAISACGGSDSEPEFIPASAGSISQDEEGNNADEGELNEALADALCAGVVCDDGNECTDEVCDEDTGECVTTFLSGVFCDDGDECTEIANCNEGECVGAAPVYCNDDNPCTEDLCDSLEGCQFPPNKAPCDDGDTCTLDDICFEGECTAGSLEDCNDDNPCTEDACENGSGCFSVAVSGECEDGNACTEGDSCFDGSCVSGIPLVCNDDDPCTTDSCDPDEGCIAENNEADCDDGNVCTAVDLCADGNCVGSGLPDCSDGNPCTDDSCEVGTGCVSVPNQESCDDGNACTSADSCSAGLCAGVDTALTACDDGNVCTVDDCIPETGCLHLPKSGSCEDGDACTQFDSCSDGECEAGTELNCDDGDVCTDDLCYPSKGCSSTANTAACDDGNVCTTDDACSEGTCVGGAPFGCDDGNVCTTDSCVAAIGCQYNPNSLVCDDGNACTTGDECSDGACAGNNTSAVVCNDGNACTTDTCDPDSGCENSFNSFDCNDGNACTTEDNCQFGTCVGGGVLTCDDGNVCTSDSCDGDFGCIFLPNALPCNDGNACTLTDMCLASVCMGSGDVNCSDGNVCTDDGCDPDMGCFSQFNTVPCDDEDACTLSTTCQGGECTGGITADCDDDNVCTDDACVSPSGCSYGLNNNACDDGDACTLSDLCIAGTCEGGLPPSCDDDNLCTEDSCDSVFGCINSVTSGACDDGDPCTENDSCVQAVCSGTNVACGDDNACTEDVCAPEQGGACTYIVVVCDDGISCTDDACNSSTGCVFPVPIGACDDGIACTVDSCTEQGCAHVVDVSFCDDGDACTEDSCDATAGCTYATGFSCCGNGVIEGNETCDDGNTLAGDGCDAECIAEGGASGEVGESCDEDDDCEEGLICTGEVGAASFVIELFEKPNETSTISLEDADGTTVTFEVDNENDGVSPGHVALDQIYAYGGGGTGTLGNLGYAIGQQSDLNLTATSVAPGVLWINQDSVGASGNTPVVLTNVGAEIGHWANVATSPIPDGFSGGSDGPGICSNGSEGSPCVNGDECEAGLTCGNSADPSAEGGDGAGTCLDSGGCVAEDATFATASLIALPKTAGQANTRVLTVTDADGNSVDFTIDNLLNESTGTQIAFGNANLSAPSFAANIGAAINAAYGANLLNISAVAYGVTVKLTMLSPGTIGNTVPDISGSAVTDGVITIGNQFSGGANGTGACIDTNACFAKAPAASKAMNAIDMSGYQAVADPSTKLNFTIPVASGGTGTTISVKFYISSSDSPPSGGPNHITIGTAGSDDTLNAALLIKAINGQVDSLITYHNAIGDGSSGVGVKGITASAGSSSTQVTLTMDSPGAEGNVSNAIAQGAGIYNLVDVTDFTGGAATQLSCMGENNLAQCTGVELSGTDQYIKVTTPADTLFNFGSGWTIEGMFKVHTPLGGQDKPRLFGTTCNYNDVFVNEDGVLVYYRWPSICYGTTKVDDGQWHHVAAVSEDGQGSNQYALYVDGNLECSSTVGNMATGFVTGLAGIEAFYIGAANDDGCGYSSGPMNHLDGEVAWVQIHETVAYEEAFTPPPSPMMTESTRLLYSLNEASGTAVFDASGNGYDGTLIGGSWTNLCLSPSEGIDCAEIHNNDPGLPDGVYVIDPDGDGPIEAYEVYCDMTTDGGGWTLSVVSSDDGQDKWTWANRHYWDTDTTVFGSVNELNKDFKSPAHHNLVAHDLLFIHAPSGIWAGYNGVGTSNDSLGSIVEGFGGSVCWDENDGFPMSSGTLQTIGKVDIGPIDAELCSTKLYFNAMDADGVGVCTLGDATYGPSWNTAYNTGCGFDDPSFASFGPTTAPGKGDIESAPDDGMIHPPGSGFGWALGENTGVSGNAENYIQLFVRRAICGNGQKEGDEECDDGNNVNGDGCSSDCEMISMDCTGGWEGATCEVCPSNWSGENCDISPLVAGLYHTCALKPDGSVECWGSDLYGQSSPPGGVFEALAAGWNHTCGLKADGSVECWGSDEYGQSSPPGDEFQALVAGYYHTCGLKADGSVACWGFDNHGQSSSQGGVFLELAAGDYHTCGLKPDGSVLCWGWDKYGQSSPPGGEFQALAAGDSYTCGLKPDGSAVCWGSDGYGKGSPPGGEFQSLTAGGHHTCGLKPDGSAVCWGSDAYAQSSPPENVVFEALAAGYYHTCGLKSEGSVLCWGQNDDGQSSPPEGLNLSETISMDCNGGWEGADCDICPSNWSGENCDISPFTAGDYHTCALNPDGSVECWGEDGSGQSSPPEGVFQALAAGHNHTCGLKIDGSVMCWGSDAYGQSSPPGGTVFETLTAGDHHTCGLKADGSVLCWGLNTYGQSSSPGGVFEALAAGNNHTCGLKLDGSVLCWGEDGSGQSNPPGGVFEALALSGNHSCGLKPDGSVVCWGSNTYAQSSPPEGMFQSLTAGGSHTCGVKLDGSVLCWGLNSFGQSSPPGGVFEALAAGNVHTCGLKSDGSLVCWGSDVYGQSSPPEGLNLSETISMDCTGGWEGADCDICPSNWNGENCDISPLVVGVYHTCGLKPDGSVVCWGSDAYGQSSPPEGVFEVVDAGAYHTCGLKPDGSVVCWGRDDYGQSSPPEGVFEALAAAWGHTCGLKPDGSVVCWGADDYGESSPPGGVFEALAAGSGHTCGLKPDGSVVCWGADGFGETSPPADSFTVLSAGGSHTCGLKPDGSVVCWGANIEGQSSPPEGVFEALAAGNGHTCGLKPDGSVVCWGLNNSGQSSAPGGVFEALSTGNLSHTCGLKPDGSVVCWGADGYGQSSPPEGLNLSSD